MRISVDLTGDAWLEGESAEVQAQRKYYAQLEPVGEFAFGATKGEAVIALGELIKEKDL